MSEITALSMLLSAVSIGIFGAITFLAYLYHRQHPSAERFWAVLAAAALTWASGTLLATAAASAAVQLDSDVFEHVTAVAAILRGGLAAFALALAYGSWMIYRGRI